MKIRQDFVTNSSSSSFLIIIEKGDYDEAIEKMGTFGKIIKETINWVPLYLNTYKKLKDF